MNRLTSTHEFNNRLLKELMDMGIRFSISEDGALCASIPQGIYSPSLCQVIDEHKVYLVWSLCGIALSKAVVRKKSSE